MKKSLLSSSNDNSRKSFIECLSCQVEMQTVCLIVNLSTPRPSYLLWRCTQNGLPYVEISLQHLKSEIFTALRNPQCPYSCQTLFDYKEKMVTLYGPPQNQLLYVEYKFSSRDELWIMGRNFNTNYHPVL